MRLHKRYNVRPGGATPGRKTRALGFLLCVSVVSFLFLGGCATTLPRPAAVTVPEIVRMSQAGYPADEIIRKIRASGTVYRLNASHLAYLKDEGVPDAVINYMQRTYLDAVERDQELADWTLWVHERDGFWYGGQPYWSWW